MIDKDRKQDGNVQLALDFIHTFHKAERVLHDLENELYRKYKLKPMQSSAIVALYLNGSMTVKELCDEISTTHGNITVVLRNLERYGLINRRPGETDRRQIRIELSESGKRLGDSLVPERIVKLSEIMSVITDSEKIVLTEMLNRFIENVETQL